MPRRASATTTSSMFSPTRPASRRPTPPACCASVSARSRPCARCRRGYVLIGHSMGGILSRLQITDSGSEIWNQAFGDRAATALKHSDPDDVIQRSLIFKADPKVRQVIFACVPHRGSPVASMSPVQFLAKLAKMPLHHHQRHRGLTLAGDGRDPGQATVQRGRPFAEITRPARHGPPADESPRLFDHRQPRQTRTTRSKAATASSPTGVRTRKRHARN